MRVLIGCEYSGVVRRAFRAIGHDAWSCDLLPAEDDSLHHIEGSVLDILRDGWDMAIFHPPCTHLSVSGARYFVAKAADGRQGRALDLVRALLDAPIERIALENPVSIISSRVRKPDQVIQPWMFGHDASKATCLWLKNLPKLKPTDVMVKDRYENQTASGQNRLAPSPDRWKERSRTYEGIAAAMAMQWSILEPVQLDLSAAWEDRCPVPHPQDPAAATPE